MKFGLHSVNLHTCGYPDAAGRIGRAAEASGFESLWVADHVVLPDPPVAGRPMAPDQRLLDPIVALTFLAAHTQRIRLATGVIILPQRLGAGARQAARLARLALDRPAHLRPWRGLVRARDALGRRAVRRAWARRRRLPGGHARGVDAAEAVVQGPVRLVRRCAGDAAPGADADAADSRGRPHSAR